jgi:hypothetical protein
MVDEKRGASMAEETTVVTETEKPEAFYADRERFWHTFTQFIVIAIVVTIIALVGMRIFLL